MDHIFSAKTVEVRGTGSNTKEKERNWFYQSVPLHLFAIFCLSVGLLEFSRKSVFHVFGVCLTLPGVT